MDGHIRCTPINWVGGEYRFTPQFSLEAAFSSNGMYRLGLRYRF
jgi:hypothetical protein